MQDKGQETSRRIRWGILGCGRIAGKFASDLQLVEDAELCAVASRDLLKAEAFARQYQVRHCHGTYEALVTNPEVDVIYVASPHGMHHAHTLLCLSHDKAVLCEKAFALNARQAGEMVALARARKVFLMEALWTKFLPHYQECMRLVQGGDLGDIRSLLVNFGFAPQAPIPDRLYDPALGGGSLLDIGIYNVFLALSVLGRPDEIDAVMTPVPGGVDEQCAVTFRYANGAIAQLFSSFASNLATEADINGTRGRVRLTSRFHEPTATIEYYPGRENTATVLPVEKLPGWGYHHEIRHVQDCLRKRLTESPVMRLSDTLLMMEVLDAIREKAGIRYPADNPLT
jgi:predicted dehydrogenase